MDGFVAARGPASPLLQPQGVIGPPNENAPARDLLEVALDAKIAVANRKQLGIDGAVRVMASRASLAHCFVLEHIGPALGHVAAVTALVFGQEQRSAAHIGLPFVRRMTIRAAQPALGNRVVAGEIELAADVIVALETHCLGRARRLDSHTARKARIFAAARGKAEWGLGFTARLCMRAAGAMARLAPSVQGVRSLGYQAGVVSRREVTIELIMTLLAFL